MGTLKSFAQSLGRETAQEMVLLIFVNPKCAFSSLSLQATSLLSSQYLAFHFPHWKIKTVLLQSRGGEHPKIPSCVTNVCTELLIPFILPDPPLFNQLLPAADSLGGDSCAAPLHPLQTGAAPVRAVLGGLCFLGASLDGSVGGFSVCS